MQFVELNIFDLDFTSCSTQTFCRSPVIFHALTNNVKLKN